MQPTHTVSLCVLGNILLDTRTSFTETTSLLTDKDTSTCLHVPRSKQLVADFQISVQFEFSPQNTSIIEILSSVAGCNGAIILLQSNSVSKCSSGRRVINDITELLPPMPNSGNCFYEIKMQCNMVSAMCGLSGHIGVVNSTVICGVEQG